MDLRFHGIEILKRGFDATRQHLSRWPGAEVHPPDSSNLCSISHERRGCLNAGQNYSLLNASFRAIKPLSTPHSGHTPPTTPTNSYPHATHRPAALLRHRRTELANHHTLITIPPQTNASTTNPPAIGSYGTTFPSNGPGPLLIVTPPTTI